jgi:saccharopine dehydrogenase (NAD+, L-lysine-forming)
MKNKVGIRREDLSKKGEKRVAIAPHEAQYLAQAGYELFVQPAQHPATRITKRAYYDTHYADVGATINEDLSEVDIIFGLKEIDTDLLDAEKVYLFFSHTHKGQKKNREMLAQLVAGRNTLIDYELITDEQGQRLITAFTYFAGYAGMTDSLWAYGRRMEQKGIDHPFSRIPQSIEKEDLNVIKGQIAAVGEAIRVHGTPASLPPMITVFMGAGKTSQGSQEIYDLLPMQEIQLAELERTFEQGSRHQVYKLVLDVPELYRLKQDAPQYGQTLSEAEIWELYLSTPDLFESNLDEVFPYTSILMNCIIWSPRFPRLLSRDQTEKWYRAFPNLEVIGDITCDPEGAIEFSKETWIDQPVFVYHPVTRKSKMGFTGEGIAVMAVTNLPCEFAADASAHFSSNLRPLLPGIVGADFGAASPEEAGLPDEIQRAVILWKGELTPDYAYMKEYL